MHEGMDDNNCVILPACKTRKMHTSRRDAFKAVNEEVIATVDFENKKTKFVAEKYLRKDSERKLKLKDKFEDKVALVKIHPNFMPSQFEAFKGYKGLVIEGTGLGQAPVGVPNELCKINEKNLKAIKELADKGCIVVMASQCIFGRVQMHVYNNAIKLAEAGVISGEDMLAETAFIKLAWLLGNYDNKEEIKEMVRISLRGEINDRIRADEEFL